MEWTGPAIFYFICLSFGFIFALIGAIFGEFCGHGSLDVGEHGFDVGHGAGIPGEAHSAESAGIHVPDGDGMPGASFFNAITLSVLLAFLGLIGLVLLWGFKVSPLVSAAIALPASIVISVGQFLLYVKLLVKAQASSEATISDVLGCEAEVITSIPGDRIGEIAYVVKGTRYTSPAASADGDDISRGVRVRVVNIKGATLVVRPV